jgi:predicted dehydrogenase
MSGKKITFALIGAGSRGLTVYADYIRQNPEQAQVVAVAEPRDVNRNRAVELHNIKPENVFKTWQDLLDRPKLADAVIIATNDRMHAEPAILAASKRYHILLEKPIAPTPAECIQIVDTVRKNNVTFAVGHVLRYAPYYEKIKQLIDEDALGQLCNIQHLEGVSWWTYAHSYVRGIFARESKSSFMLLAKSCHDIDLIRWWVGKKCLAVSSFGSLNHFRPENKPKGAADRCMDCPLADHQCPYSAKKFYFDRLHKNELGRPLHMVISEFTDAALEKALREGPYGRCVYQCDNDVVDHQVVSMHFEDNIDVNFTMSAFTPKGRQTRIMGSKGYLEGDEETIRVLDFASQKWTQYDAAKLYGDLKIGHGGGDARLVQSFINAVRSGNPNFIKTGPDITLESHMMVFAAERARRENRIVRIEEMYYSPTHPADLNSTTDCEINETAEAVKRRACRAMKV